jgi:hypothetical protein
MVLPQSREKIYGTVTRLSIGGSYKYTRVKGTDVCYVHSFFESRGVDVDIQASVDFGGHFDGLSLVGDLREDILFGDTDPIDVVPIEESVFSGGLERRVDEQDPGTEVFHERQLPTAGEDYPNIRGYETDEAMFTRWKSIGWKITKFIFWTGLTIAGTYAACNSDGFP